jgi:hypothetical protein
VKRGLNGTALVTSRVDFNRDGRINALDLAACKSNLNRGLVLTNLLAAVPLAALAADLSPAGSSATAVTRSLLGERA